VWDLFCVHATDEQMDSRNLRQRAGDGYAKVEMTPCDGHQWSRSSTRSSNISRRRAPIAGEGFKLLVATWTTPTYLGRIAFGKIYSGKVKVGDSSVCIHGDGRKKRLQDHGHLPFRRPETNRDYGSSRRGRGRVDRF